MSEDNPNLQAEQFKPEKYVRPASRLATSDPRQGWTYFGRSDSDPTHAHRCENCAARAPRDTKCDLCGWSKAVKRKDSFRK